MGQQINIGEIEEIKIERERKYKIPDERTANLLIQHIPDEIIIPIPQKSNRNYDANMLKFLHNVLIDSEKPAEDILSIKSFVHGESQFIVKHRPNYYFDTSDDVLTSLNISFGLRQRENDWGVTIKLKSKKSADVGKRTGIHERIEFSFLLDNEVIESAKSGDEIDIEKVINQKPELKETFDLRIKKQIADKKLIVKEFFVINSTRVLYPLANNGLIHISVDEILSNNRENLYEFEIEILFGVHNNWLDTISIRAFDFFCLLIISAIKKRLEKSYLYPKEGSANNISQQDIENLFGEVIQLTKKERITSLAKLSEEDGAVENPNLSFELTSDEDGSDIEVLTEKIFNVLRLGTFKDLMPCIIVPYWIHVAKVYGDVMPGSQATDNAEIELIYPEKSNKRQSFSKNEILNYRNFVLDSLQVKFNEELKKLSTEPEAYSRGLNPKAKVLVLKMTQSTRLLIFFYPTQSESHEEIFNQCNTVLRKLLKTSAINAGGENILSQVEVDCSVLCNNMSYQTIGEGQISMDTVNLYTLDSRNESEAKRFLEYKLEDGEIKLQKIVGNRYHIKRYGVKEPVMLVESQTQAPGNLAYFDILGSESMPLTLKSMKSKA